MKKKVALLVILVLLVCNFNFAYAKGGGGFLPGLAIGGLMGCLAAQQVRTTESHPHWSPGEQAAFERGRAEAERQLQWEREHRAYEHGRYGGQRYRW